MANEWPFNCGILPVKKGKLIPYSIIWDSLFLCLSIDFEVLPNRIFADVTVSFWSMIAPMNDRSWMCANGSILLVIRHRKKFQSWLWPIKSICEIKCERKANEWSNMMTEWNWPRFVRFFFLKFRTFLSCNFTFKTGLSSIVHRSQRKRWNELQWISDWISQVDVCDVWSKSIC